MALPPLEVRIDADDRGLQRGLDRAQGGIRKFAAFAGGAFSGLGLGIASAVAGVMSFSAAIDGAKQAMGEFDALAKRARASGLSSDFFQVLQLSAEEAGVAQETLNGALISFVKRVGEAQAGSGALVSIFKKLRPDLLEQIKTTKSQEEAFKLVADAIGSVKDAQQQAALAAAAFNKSGIGMIEMLRNGRQGLDDTAKKARELGLIIDQSLLTNAEQLNNDFGVAVRVLSIHFKTAVIELAPYITRLAVAISSAVRELSRLIGFMRAVDNKSISQLNDQLERTDRALERLRGKSYPSDSAEEKARITAINSALESQEKIRARLKELEPKPIQAPGIIDANIPGVTAGAGKGKGKGAAVDELGERFKALQESLKTREQILTEQYERDLALLEVYHEREKTAEEKRIEDRLALQRQYSAAVGQIRAKEQQAASNAILGGAEQIFNALGVRNKKMLRMAKIFGAANALVSTMTGAAKALELPFPANIAAAAAVVAKGIGFVNAIKGTGEGGTTGGGRAGGGGAGAASAPAVTQEGQRSTAAVINLSGGDMFSRDQVVSLINSINEAMEDGARLRIA
jgi:hypothetical protein